MTEERRKSVAPEVIEAIQIAVRSAFEENAHKCVVGFSLEDKNNLQELKILLNEYPASKLRESFSLMKTLVRARNVAGNIFLGIFFSGLFLWLFSKLFPDIWSKQ